jgi:hypothetical protein
MVAQNLPSRSWSYKLKKITVDIRPNTHQRLRLLSVILDRSITSLVSSAIESLLAEQEETVNSFYNRNGKS